MANDQVNGKKQERKSIHFFVPHDFHRRIKMMCAYEDKTLKSYVEGALLAALEKSEKVLQNARSATGSSTSSSLGIEE